MNRDITESRERRDERYNSEYRRPYRNGGNAVQREVKEQDSCHGIDSGKKNIKENIFRLLDDKNIDDSTKLMAESLVLLANKIEHSTRIMDGFTKTMEGFSKIFDEALKKENAKRENMTDAKVVHEIHTG